MPTIHSLWPAIQSLLCRAGNRPGCVSTFIFISTRGLHHEQGRQAGRNNRSSGFTLIELVVVIVILGILAATALPKFIDMGKDARVAALEGLKGAIWSAASMAQAKCAVSSTCNVNNSFAATPSPYITVGSDKFWFDYGWPAAWEGGGYKSITDLTSLSGFTAKPYVNGSFHRIFTKDGAPTPDDCSVKYQLPNGLAPPAITTTTTGC